MDFQKIKNVSKKIRYVARVANWLADALASFPFPEKEESNKPSAVIQERDAKGVLEKSNV